MDALWLFVRVLPMFDAGDHDDHFFMFDQIKQPIIPNPVSIIPFKFPFEFFDVGSKKRVFFELRVDNGLDFLINVRIEFCFEFLKLFGFGDAIGQCRIPGFSSLAVRFSGCEPTLCLRGFHASHHR